MNMIHATESQNPTIYMYKVEFKVSFDLKKNNNNSRNSNNNKRKNNNTRIQTESKVYNSKRNEMKEGGNSRFLSHFHNEVGKSALMHFTCRVLNSIFHINQKQHSMSHWITFSRVSQP